MKVVSVNVGSLQPLKMGRRTTKTGHLKSAVGSARVEELGLVDDAIGNLKHHGGADQAVYVYSAEDYRWWEEHLGRDLPFGTFGENLTVSDFGGRAPRVGDIWECGEVRLQMTAPRIPCATLAARMENPRFVKEFARVNRGGAYARVLRPGLLSVGQSIVLEPFAGSSPSIDELFELWHQPEKDPELLRQALTTPLASRARAAFEFWLTLH